MSWDDFWDDLFNWVFGEKKFEDVAVVTIFILAFVFLYAFYLTSFLEKNYWWISLMVIYVVYFLFRDVYLKKRETDGFLKKKGHWYQFYRTI